jgi:myo-inositol-hexaphosphate 3-phosphohydrolase
MTQKLKIVWSSDEYDCKTCGSQWAEGAVVTLDDTVILDKPAVASCFGAEVVEWEDIARALCEHLSIEVEEVKP